jgi:hypothetical protein
VEYRRCDAVGEHIIGGLSAELALPGSPHSVKAPVLARGQLAELVIRLLGKFEDVVGDGQDVIVVEHSEKVIRVDTSTRCVRYEEGAIRIVRRGKCVHVKVSFTFIMRPRGYMIKEQLVSAECT